MSEKFSFSKLNTCNKQDGGCPFKYKLTYIDKHFIKDDNIANEFGTLVHYIEENIARDIINNDNEPIFMIDNNKYKDMFLNINLKEDNKNIIGVNILKEKYKDDFYIKDKTGLSYEDKVNNYLKTGINRLQNYLVNNKNIKLVDVEKEFNINFGDYIFHGFIDRILKDTSTGEYLIEDIKTWSDYDGHNLTTPLQFVFYSLAVQEMFNISEDKISCFYELPCINTKVSAGTNNFMKRGIKKINELLKGIENKEFAPNPSPLCYYCVFSATNPKQPEEAKNLCPYYCLWTKEKKTFDCKNEWMGLEYHEQILEAFKQDKNIVKDLKNKKFENSIKKPLIINDSRIFLIRR